MSEDTRGAVMHGSTLTYFFMPFNAGIRISILERIFPEICRRVHFKEALTEHFQRLCPSLRKGYSPTSPDHRFKSNVLYHHAM